ncbi:MAG TPA: GNAT family N-acetyltransferase [Polyangiaceae bacterium]|nr:GNAT family N-acetyltransferase [Polyangiaceae bacterium]
MRAARPDEMDLVIAIDDDAIAHYATAGITFDLAADHPFAVAEYARWTAALTSGDVFFSLAGGEPVGFAVMGLVDGEPYLEQLSVRRAAMRRGHGSALFVRALDWARARSDGGLWLNTYGHLSWNRPFYERRGFVLVAESEWRTEMRGVVAAQRAVLPRPEQRVVMRHA